MSCHRSQPCQPARPEQRPGPGREAGTTANDACAWPAPADLHSVLWGFSLGCLSENLSKLTRLIRVVEIQTAFSLMDDGTPTPNRSPARSSVRCLAKTPRSRSGFTPGIDPSCRLSTPAAPLPVTRAQAVRDGRPSCRAVLALGGIRPPEAKGLRTPSGASGALTPTGRETEGRSAAFGHLHGRGRAETLGRLAGRIVQRQHTRNERLDVADALCTRGVRGQPLGRGLAGRGLAHLVP